jgi:hypothetical protein
MKVEVEIEDLETIVFATAIIKIIESNLKTRKEDPFVQPHLEYTKAHDSLVLAMNSARRSSSPTTVPWDGELSKNELRLLTSFKIATQHEPNPVFEISPEYRLKHEEVDGLVSKGCIRIGQLVAGAVWPGEPKADIKPIPGFALSITQRGNEKLAKALQENETKP